MHVIHLAHSWCCLNSVEVVDDFSDIQCALNILEFNFKLTVA